MTPLAVSFGNGWLLAAVLLAPLLLYIHLQAQRGRQRYPVRFTAMDTLASVVPAGPDWRRHAPVALLAAAIAAMAVALAKPERTVDVAIQRASVVLVTDVSRSMQAIDVPPSRLDAARNAALGFVDQVPEEVRVGLVAFSDAALTLQTPTTEHDQVASALSILEPINGTATGAGLRAAVDELDAIRDDDPRRPPGAIILLSDGAAQDGDASVRAAERARQRGYPVFTVALGTPEGQIELPDGRIQLALPDPEALREIARISGGESYEAQDAERLNAVYEGLGRQLGTEQEKRQFTSGIAGVALMLLLGAVIAGLRWGVRPL